MPFRPTQGRAVLCRICSGSLREYQNPTLSFEGVKAPVGAQREDAWRRLIKDADTDRLISRIIPCGKADLLHSVAVEVYQHRCMGQHIAGPDDSFGEGSLLTIVEDVNAMALGPAKSLWPSSLMWAAAKSMSLWRLENTVLGVKCRGRR